MEEAIKAVLLDSAAITALAGTRINWGLHPQGASLPGIVLTTVSDGEGFTMDGPDGLSRARVQVDCYAASYLAAKQLSRVVWAVLNGHRGDPIQGVFLAGARDAGRDADGTGPFGVSLDFLVHYNRS